MDFWSTVLVLFRRWYVVLPAFLLTLGAAAAAYSSVPAQYLSQSAVLLTAPTTGSVAYADGYQPEAINPLLNLDNGLNLTGSLLIQAMRTAEFASRIGVPADGPTTFEVNNGSDNPELLQNGPFLFLSATSSSPDEAEGVVQRSVAAAREELQRRQEELDAPRSTYVTFTEIVPPTPAEAQRGDRLRPAAAALALGAIASLAATFAAESLFMARRRRAIGTSSAGRRRDESPAAPPRRAPGLASLRLPGVAPSCVEPSDQAPPTPGPHNRPPERAQVRSPPDTAADR